MAKKRKTLPNDLQEIIDSRDLDRFQAVFEKCELSATNRGMTAENVFPISASLWIKFAFFAKMGWI